MTTSTVQVPTVDELVPLRAIWKMQITKQCMTDAALCSLVPWGTTDIGRLPGNVIHAAQSLVHELTAEAARAELARGLRARKDILHECNTRLWDLMKLFRPTNWRTHPSAPGAFPVPRGTDAALTDPRGTTEPNSEQEK